MSLSAPLPLRAAEVASTEPPPVTLTRPQALQQLNQLPQLPTAQRKTQAFLLARWAIHQQQADLLDRLVPALVPFESTDEQGYTLPMWMVRYGRTRALSRWSVAGLKQARSTGETPLSMALERNDLGAIRVLLQAGVGDPRWLSYAVLQGRSEAMALFFRYGYSPFDAPELWPALILSARAETLNVLLRYGLDLRATQASQAHGAVLQAPLRTVLASEQRDVTDWLVAWDSAWAVRFADLLASPAGTQAPPSLALAREHLRQALLQQVTPPTFFAQRPALPLAFRPGSVPQSVPPMLQAASLNRVDHLEKLLTQEVSVEEADAAGNTPLHVASALGHEAVVRWLLAQRAPLNLQNRDLKTPLITAVQQGELAVVKLLLAQGADPGVRDVKGLQAKDYARQRYETTGQGQEVLLLLSQKSIGLRYTSVHYED